VRDSPCKDISQSAGAIHFRAEPARLPKGLAQVAGEYPGNTGPEAMLGPEDEFKGGLAWFSIRFLLLRYIFAEI
jgi:hypothetical protein